MSIRSLRRSIFNGRRRKPTALMGADDFSSSGDLAGSFTPGGGKRWSQRILYNGAVSFSSNAITKSGGTVGSRTTAGPGVSIIDAFNSGRNNVVVSAVVATPGASAATKGGGLAFRVAGSIGLIVLLRQSDSVDGYSFGRVNADGSIAVVQTTTQVPVAGDVIQVTAADDIITIKVNGIQIMQVTETTNNTASDVGLYYAQGLAGATCRFDDFICYEYIAPRINAAPSAGFIPTISGSNVTVVSSAVDTDGSISSYSWNWGDGASSTGETSTHTYTAAGTYSITSTVTDDEGATASQSQSVTILTVVASDTFSSGTNLAGSVTTSGSKTWMQRLTSSGASSTSSNAVTKSGGLVGPRSGSTGPGATIYNIFDSGVPNFTAQVRLIAQGANAAARNAGIGFRVASNGTGFAFVTRQSASVEGFSLVRIAAGGAQTVIATSTRIPAADDWLRVTANGDSITCQVASGVEAGLEPQPNEWISIIQATDATNNTATEVGLYFGATSSSLEVRFDNYTLYGGTPVITPPVEEPPIETVGAVEGIRSHIARVRDEYYPDGVRYPHLPPYWTWPRVYAVPPGSNFVAPADKPGYVYKGMRPGDSSGVMNYIGPDRCVILVHPEKYIDVGERLEIDLFRGVISQGPHYYNTAFRGGANPAFPAYRSAAAAEAKVAGTQIPNAELKGKAYYDPSPNLQSAGAIDGPERFHEQTIYPRSSGAGSGNGAGNTAEEVFYALEAPYIEGDFCMEGINANGVASNATLCISGYRNDRASVFYKKNDDAIIAGSTSGYSAKVPGGDIGQFFGRWKRIIIDGYTGITALQGIFLQHDNGELVHINKADLHGATDFGGATGFQWWPGGARTRLPNWEITDMYCWRGGAGTIERASEFPEIKNQDVPHYISHAEAQANGGVAYAANPVPLPTGGARTGRATLATVGPTLPESGMAVINGNLTITTDNFKLYNTLVNGYIIVKANNVEIDECIQRAPAYAGTTVQFGIKASDVNATTFVPYTGLVVKNTSLEVPSANRNVYQGSGIAGGNYTLRNVHISGYVDAMGVFGTGQGYRRYLDADRVYAHDMPFYASDPAQVDGSHNDGLQDQGRSKVSLTRSVVLGGRTSAILIQQNIANVGSETNHESVFIDDNFLDLEYDGGAVLNVSESGKGIIANLTITNNDFGNTFPAKPRMIMPNSTKNAATTTISNNKMPDNSEVVIAVGA